MSANAWRSCPRCLEQYEQETERIDQRAEDAYGKLPVEEYIRLAAEATNRPDFEKTADGASLREDYAVFTDEDGEFHISYHCNCVVCGLEFSYQYKERVYRRADSWSTL